MERDEKVEGDKKGRQPGDAKADFWRFLTLPVKPVTLL